jgi:flagellar basal body-associated protein FliL
LKKTSMATIAVAVAVPVGVLVLAGIAYMWWRIRRQRKQNRAIHEASSGIQNSNGPINGFPSDLTQVKRAELSGDQRYGSELAELPSDRRG